MRAVKNGPTTPFPIEGKVQEGMHGEACKLFYTSLKGGLVYSLIARVQRGESSTARCVSRGSNQAAPSVSAS